MRLPLILKEVAETARAVERPALAKARAIEAEIAGPVRAVSSHAVC